MVTSSGFMHIILRTGSYVYDATCMILSSASITKVFYMRYGHYATFPLFFGGFIACSRGLPGFFLCFLSSPFPGHVSLQSFLSDDGRMWDQTCFGKR